MGWNWWERLSNYLNFLPIFFSVTFGAAGTSQQGTVETVQLLQQETITPIAAHLSCVHLSKEHLIALIHDYKNMGVKSLVVVRGDMVKDGAPQGDIKFANQLVELIRHETGNHFKIYVAAFTQLPSEPAVVEKEMAHFKMKVAAGADAAITQFFFNAEQYFRFCEMAKKFNINVPIIPGIMPIQNLERLVSFAKRCGAEIPSGLISEVERLGHDEAAIQKYCFDYVYKLCDQLLQGGAPGLHFYTLNKLNPTFELINRLTSR